MRSSLNTNLGVPPRNTLWRRWLASFGVNVASGSRSLPHFARASKMRSHPIVRSRRRWHTWMSEPKAPNTADLADLDQREAPTARALDLLQAGKPRAYDKALGALSEETRRQWEEVTKPEPSLLDLNFGDAHSRYDPDAEGLREFLVREVMPRYEDRRKVLQNGPLIREQVIGEALDAGRLEGLARYEIHLDRKLERMLSTLIRLQELRAPPAQG
jgi:hypothetical protein